jgi:hypothetical protein
MENKALEIAPRGCMCLNNGAGDCDYCEALEIAEGVSVQSDPVEYRGVKAWVEIKDHQDIPDRYLTVSVYFDPPRLGDLPGEAGWSGPMKVPGTD